MAARTTAKPKPQITVEGIEDEALDAVDYFALAIEAFQSAYDLAHARGEAPQGLTAGLEAAAPYLASYQVIKGA